MTISSFPKIYNVGHAAITGPMGLLIGEVTVEEKVDGCVSLDTSILLSDLTYKPAGHLKVGDKLLAFSEDPNKSRLCESEVTIATPIIKRGVLIKTQNRALRCSIDHPLLVSKPNKYSENTHNKKKWVEAKDLKPGDKIVSLPVWDSFDGEGSLVRHKNGRILSVYQTVGPTFDYVCSILDSYGFKYFVDIRQRQENWKQVASLVIRGGWLEIMRFLGVFRPSRLLPKAKEKLWNNAPLNSMDREEVVSIEEIGNIQVMGLSTTSKTYIANGLFSHNSQFSFGVLNGEIVAKSKGMQLVIDAPEKMFNKAIETVKRLAPQLHPGWTYRGEYLQNPKHNALAYDRAPKDHIILFDINIEGEEQYLSYEDKAAEAARLGLEIVPLVYKGPGEALGMEQFKHMLDRVSVLGGAKIEGIVIKNYSRFSRDAKVMMGKHVSEDFKEVHRHDWKKTNPTNKDIILMLSEEYRSEARWQKAIQHLAEAGKLLNEPKDIAPLIKEVQKDIEEECIEEIKEKLWNYAKNHIMRGAINGLPQWYKERLLEEQVNETQLTASTETAIVNSNEAPVQL